MASINDFGQAGDPLNAPSLPAWAAAVAAALDGSDETVNTRIAAAVDNLKSQVTRTSHPNGDDVLVEAWDEGKGRWQRIHYDSGWRDVSSLLINGWTIASPGRVLMRRIGSMVRLTTDTGGAHYLDASAATNNNFLTLPDTTWVPAQSNPGIAFFNQQMAGLYRNSNPYRLAVQNATTIGEKRWVISLDWPVFTDSIPTYLPGTLATAAPN